MLSPNDHTVGPADGTLQVHTFREGMAQKIGHDLVIEVRQWQATARTGEDGTLTAIEAKVDSSSLHVREGHHGVKPLTDKDREEIRKNIDKQILRRQAISFRSDTVRSSAGGLSVQGELTVGSESHPISFGLETTADGRVRSTVPLTQSQWGIKPYRAFMGALKVRDDVHVVIDVQL